MSTWTQIGSDIDADAAGDWFGWEVRMSSNGKRVAVGARNHNSTAGHVKIFELNSGSWTQLGSDIDGVETGDNSGLTLSLSDDGSIVAIGAAYHDNSRGHCRMFQYSNGSWTQMGSDIDGVGSNDGCCTCSLSSDGLTAAIGAQRHYGSAYRSGHIRIFKYISGSWSNIGDINGEAQNDFFGLQPCLSSDGTIIAIGAHYNDGNGDKAGHTRIFQYDNSGNTWTQIGQDIDGEAAGDLAGFSVSLSSDGTIVAIGATNNDANGSNSGQASNR